MRIKWISYCGGALGLSLVYATVNSMVIAFYKNVDYAKVAISIATVGAIISYSKALEACLEPIAGRLVDKWGISARAIIMIVTGVILSAAVLIMFGPASLSRLLSPVTILALTLTAFALAYALFYVTHSSLLVDLADSPTTKLQLSTNMATYGLVGTIMGLIAAPIVASAYGFRSMALIIAVVAVVLLVLSSFSALNTEATIREVEEVEGAGIFSTAKAALRKNEFRALTFARALGGVATNMTVVGLPLLPPIFRKDLAFSGIVYAVMMSACLLGFFLIRRFAKRLGSGWVLIGSLITMGTGIGTLGIATRTVTLSLLFFAAALIGIGLSGYFALPNAFLAEIVDTDRKSNGINREAALFGIHFFLVNMGKSLAGVLAGLTLSLPSREASKPQALFVVASAFAFASGIALWAAAKRDWFAPSRLWYQTISSAGKGDATM